MKKIGKILAIVLLLLAVVAGGTTYYFYTHIKPILITEINKSLAVKVSLNEIKLSGITEFPKLGITLSQVAIDESTPYYKKKLLKARELNLYINVWKIYQGEYVIDAITLKSGELNVADLKKGTNYDILKTSDNEESSEVNFEIKTLKLVDCNVHYTHTPSKYSTVAYTPSSTIGLKYQGELTHLDMNAKLDGSLVVYGRDTFINKLNLSINSEIEINTATEEVAILPSTLIAEEVELDVEGSVDYSQESAIDITFGNKKAPAYKIISILPADIKELLSGINLGGNIELNGFFKGKTYGNHSLAFGFDYTTKDLSLEVGEQGLSLENIQSFGSLKMPSLDDLTSSAAQAKLSSTTLNTGSLNGNLSISNFDRPKIRWDGAADLAINFIIGMADYQDMKDVEGRFKTDGKLSLVYDPETESLAYNSLLYEGNASVEGFSGNLLNPNLDVESFDLKLFATESDLSILESNFRYNSTSGNFKGEVINYRSLLNQFPNATLEGMLVADGFNLNDFMSSDSSSGSAEIEEELVPIKLDLSINLTDFKYNDFTADKARGRLTSDKKNIRLPRCKIEALEGTTTATIGLKKWGENYLLDINSELEGINISELLRQFNNFEQDEITHKHLSGKLSGTIVSKIILKSDFEPELSKLYTKAKVKIEDGALVNYEPLQELSAFVHVEDLRNVKFKTLENEIEIFDETIFIPQMMIRNNALNLELEGTHTFENYMKYNMGLSVAELLATKAKWIAKKNEKRIEKNIDGGLTAYIIMEGTPDDLSIKYDRATVRENVRNEVKNEKQNFIRALKGEASLEDNGAKNKNYDDVWDE